MVGSRAGTRRAAGRSDRRADRDGWRRADDANPGALLRCPPLGRSVQRRGREPVHEANRRVGAPTAGDRPSRLGALAMPGLGAGRFLRGTGAAAVRRRRAAPGYGEDLAGGGADPGVASPGGEGLPHPARPDANSSGWHCHRASRRSARAGETPSHTRRRRGCRPDRGNDLGGRGIHPHHLAVGPLSPTHGIAAGGHRSRPGRSPGSLRVGRPSSLRRFLTGPHYGNSSRSDTRGIPRCAGVLPGARRGHPPRARAGDACLWHQTSWCL